jgi:hypothetical protein
MLNGNWLSDPACGTYTWQAGEGFPPGIFDYQLAKMVRRGLSLEPRDRTRADRWRTVLAEALIERRLYTDESCNGTVFLEPSRTRCPYCLQDYPLAKLVFPQLHKAILIDSAAVPIGRKELLSPRVSARHAVARRFGPLVQIESFGSNGTYRLDQAGWTRLPDQQAVMVEPGDRLRFADVECRVETA